ncbi:MAG: MaoC family dehydratase [Syntrophales bacterium]|jgi:acyl dehydratase|nr:MaoC family dehydratase [Syntrophales bacterium]MDY0045440.1 MaoC family dehydratase [Syntrophales bacterium]
MEFEKRETFGRYFEEFNVGDLYRHWPGKTITESDNNLFCLLTMNHHPLHLDAGYAESQQLKRIVVVGTLILSVAVGMSVADISGKAVANLDYESIAHDGPVFVGDTIYSETEVLSKKESRNKPDRGVVYVETRTYNQDGVRVCTLRRHVLIPKRGK